MGEKELLQAVSTVGFPIVAYLLLFLKSDKTTQALTLAVNNNTIAISKILEREGINNG